MKLFRFVLAFDGEPQGVGILNGLYDTPLDLSKANQIMEAFSGLKSPDLDETLHPVFFFTERGLLQYCSDLYRIQKVIRDFGWDVLVSYGDVSEAAASEAVYRDGFQIAFAADGPDDRDHMVRMLMQANHYTKLKNVFALAAQCEDVFDIDDETPKRFSVRLDDGTLLTAEANTDPAFRGEIYLCADIRDSEGVFTQDLAIVRGKYTIEDGIAKYPGDAFEVLVNEHGEDFTQTFEIFPVSEEVR